jgi:hypothetical protein
MLTVSYFEVRSLNALGFKRTGICESHTCGPVSFSPAFEEQWWKFFLWLKACRLFDGFASHYEDIWGCEGIAPPFLTCALDGGEGQFHRPLLHPWGKRPRYRLDWWFGGIQNQSGSLAPAGNRTLVVQHVASPYTDILAPTIKKIPQVAITCTLCNMYAHSPFKCELQK